MDDAEKFTWKLSLGIAVVLAVVLALTLPMYMHERPAADCSKPALYPICYRASAPEMLAPPPSVWVFLSIIITAIIALILLYYSYHACVIEQAHIVAPKTEKAPEKQPEKVVG